MVVFALDCDLQLAAHDHDGNFLEDAQGAGVFAARFEGPAAPGEVFGMLPEGLGGGAEYVDAVFEGEGGEGEVVVKAVEGCYVGDGIGEKCQRAGAGLRGGLLVIELVDVLKRERSEFGQEGLVQVCRAAGRWLRCGWF